MTQAIHRHHSPLAALRRVFAYVGHGVRLLTPMLPQIAPHGRQTVREISVGDLTLRCCRDANCKELLGQWDDLAARVPDATPFQSPHWNRSLLVHPQRLGRLRLVTVSRGDALLAVVPLEIRLGGHLQTVGGLLSDYLDPLVDPAEHRTFWRAMLKNVDRLVGKKVRSMTLENQSDRQAAQVEAASIASEAGFQVKDEITESVTRIALRDSWDKYLGGIDSHERKELRRKLRKAEQAGAALHCCTSPREISAELTSLFALMAKGGGGKGRKARWMFPKHFDLCALKLAQQGKLRVYRLTIEKTYAAGMIAFPTPRGEILWCGGFDPMMRQWSPGIVTFSMLIRQAIARGEQCLDLLRSPHEYKYRLGGIDHPLYRRVLQKN